MDLGHPTGQLPPGHADPPPWISALSIGGLTVPSDAFLALLYNFESVFKAIHGETIWYGKGAVAMLRSQLQEQHPNVPVDIIKTYSRGRTFLRYKHGI